MSALALVLALALTAIATLHAYWGIGGVWPGRDQASCARAVIGTEGAAAMPAPAASLAVALAMVVSALVALALGEWFATPFSGIRLAGMALFLCLLFGGRGLAAYTSWWRRMTPEQPFARLDTRLYAPVCLCLAAGFLMLSLEGFTS